jgi:hypothetical protein
MSTDGIEIEFVPAGVGIADCTLRIGAARFTMGGICYTTDALGELVRAAVQMATGGSQAICRFDCEPAEWRMVLDREWRSSTNDFVWNLRVFDLGDFYSDLPLDDHRKRFEAKCDGEEFAAAIARTASAVLSALGPDGYEEWWCQPFPLRASAALDAALASQLGKVR